MALETALADLHGSLRGLRDALLALRTTIVEDKPLEDDVVLVDVFRDATDDLLGLLDEALAAFQAPGADPAAARRTITICQRQFNHIAQRFGADMVSYGRIAALTRFGRRRGGEWHAWTRSVKHGLESCQEPLFDTNQAVFRCWQALTEHAAPTLALRATIFPPTREQPVELHEGTDW